MTKPCLDHGLSGNKPGGYHQVRIKGRLYYVHRLAYAEANGLDISEVPPLLRHTCDNPRCIEPTHLIPGTHQDNANDRVARGRSAKKQPRRLKLTQAQADEIRARYASRRRDGWDRVNGLTALAREFNVTKTLIHNIIHRRAYA